MSDKSDDDESIFHMIVTHEGAVILGSWIGRLLAVLAIVLLVLAENHAVSTVAGLEEGAKSVVSAKADAVDPKNEGKLVHVTGEISTKAGSTDSDFGINAPALRLSRRVEVYQWTEEKTETKKNDKTVTSYTYKKEWSTSKPKTSFEEKKGHENPEEPAYKDATFTAPDAQLGVFQVNAEQLKLLKDANPLPITADILSKRSADHQKQGTLGSDGKLFVSLTAGSSLDAPAVGDVLIQYSSVAPQVATIVAKQTGSAFEPYVSKSGSSISIVELGNKDTKEMFESAHGNSSVINWALRVLLIILLTPAVYLMIRPMAHGSGLDLMSFRLNIAFLVFAAIASTFIVLAFVGARWLAYFPVFAGEMLAIGIVGLFLCRLFLRRFDKSGLFTAAQKFAPDEVDLFRKIALDPENQTLRTQLAELLVKRGNPLGEFMQVDREIDAFPEGDARRTALDPRWSELFEKHTPNWFQGLKQLGLQPYIGGTFAPNLWMNQGIIDKIDLYKPKVLPQKAKQLFDAAPGLRAIEVHTMVYRNGTWVDIDKEFDFPGMFQVPQMEQIGELDLSSAKITVEIVEHLCKSPYLKNLKTLNIGSNTIGSKGAQLLAQSAALGQLRDLNLQSCHIEDAGLKSLAESSHLKQIQKLCLGNNDLTIEGIRALAQSPTLTQLTDLDLGGNTLSPESLELLAASANLQHLTKLELDSISLNTAGFQALIASPYLGQLRMLELDSSDLDASAMKLLQASTNLGQLEELKLNYCQIGDEGLAALSNWPGLAHVKRLEIRSNNITATGIKALAASPYVAALEELDLASNEAGVSGARALVASETLAKLKKLTIGSTEITPEGEQLLKVRFGEGLNTY